MDLTDIVRNEEESHAVGICRMCAGVITDTTSTDLIDAGVCSSECFALCIKEGVREVEGRLIKGWFNIDSDPEAFSDEFEERQQVLKDIASGVYDDKAPSFKALHGRRPVAGVDYDPDKPMCQDDYEYFSGEGGYTDKTEKDDNVCRECEYCGNKYSVEFGRCPDCDMPPSDIYIR